MTQHFVRFNFNGSFEKDLEPFLNLNISNFFPLLMLKHKISMLELDT